MSYRNNVVERLYVVRAKIGDGKYAFRVQAESDETAKEKARRQMRQRFNEKMKCEILSVERIDPEDFI